VAHAVHLLHAGHGRRLLVTGGVGKHPPAEAEVMRQLALAAGVSEACILVEDQATSTFQSAVYCARMLCQHGWGTVLVVTDRYHLPRTLLTFRSLGLQAQGSAPATAACRPHWQQWYYRLREGLACLWYTLRIVAWKARRLLHPRSNPLP
jgi:uncharacterized SAM-binding protein YcdF (DUF218 family)